MNVKIKIKVNRYDEKPYNGMIGKILATHENYYAISLSKKDKEKINDYNNLNCSNYTKTPNISKENIVYFKSALNIE